MIDIEKIDYRTIKKLNRKQDIVSTTATIIGFVSMLFLSAGIFLQSTETVVIGMIGMATGMFGLLISSILLRKVRILLGLQ